MKILVTVKRVPDTAAEKRLDPADKTLDRESVETILNPVDEYAVEEALRLLAQRGREGDESIAPGLRRVRGGGLPIWRVTRDDG